MKMSSAFRVALLALMALSASLSSVAYADDGFVSLTIYKVDGSSVASGGGGTLNFHGRSYALSAGGLDYGLVFGGSKTVLRGPGEQHLPALRRRRRLWRGGARDLRSAAARARSF